MTLLPLGDRTDRRRLIVGQTLVLAVALLLVTLAPTARILLAGSLLMGIASTIPQQIIPFAADLAAPQKRGAVIGTVMSGLLCGILLARTLSGFVGEHYGWRTVFGLGIVLSLGTAAVLAAILPSREPATRLPYARLIASTFTLVRDEPKLRTAAAIQTCLFSSFGVFWTVLALRLEQPPYRLGADVAGLFGIVGAVGALAAPLAGRVADRYGPGLGIGIGIGATALAWAILGTLTPLAAMVVGVIILDAGVQAAMIGNQHIIFALRPEARNRLNTVFMGALFSGGAVGSAGAMVVWRAGGWTPVAVLGFALCALAALVYGASVARRNRG